MSDKLTIIFVIGAWHTEFHVQPITPYLEKAGYRVVPVRLHTSGNHDPLPVMQDNVDKIERIMKREIDAGHRICILGHSLGGQPISGALEAFLKSSTPEQQAKLVYMIFIASFWNPQRPFSESNWFEIDFENSWWTNVVLPTHEVFYNDMSPTEAKPFVDALDVHRAQTPPEVTGDWTKTTKGTYFVCKQDQAVPAKFQRMEAEENGLNIVELDTAHCPMISNPASMAEKINEVLKEYK